MNVSLNWLSEYIDLSGKSVQELDDLLTFAGIEIEGIHTQGVNSEKIVVAQIMEAVQHPNADRLKVTQVDAGEVELNVDKMNQLMGGSISLEDAEDILTRLGLYSAGENLWSVPSTRADLQRHIDLVEEIARVHGLDNVPSRTQGSFVPASEVDAAADTDMALRRSLAALGYYEAQTIKLISEKQMIDAFPLRPLQEGDLVKVSHPLSEDHAILRPSLIPGLVSTRLMPSRERALDFSSPVWLLEMDLAKLRKLLSRRAAVEELPQFPGSTRDAAMEVPNSVTAAAINKVILQANEKLLVNFHCFDVFVDPTGVKLDSSKKSMAYRFSYRAADRTLKAEEVDAAHQNVLNTLVNQLSLSFR